MRLVHALLFALALVAAPPALAQTGPACTLTLDDGPTDYTTYPLPGDAAGRMVIRRNDMPSNMRIVAGSTVLCFRRLSWLMTGGKFVPQFTLEARPVIMADPIQRVTVEFASGRKEVR